MKETILKEKLSNHCWRLYHDPVITWDGLVFPVVLIKMRNINWVI